MASHDNVAHAWAHKLPQNWQGFAMFHRDGIIFSYGDHFPIAKHTEDTNGNPCILFTTQSYSATTSKHKSIVWCAIPPGIPIYDVADVLANTSQTHSQNHSGMVAQMQDSLKKAKRARSYKSLYMGEAEKLRTMANQYAKAFALNIPELPALENMEEWVAKALERERQEKLAQDKRDKEAIRKWLRGETHSAPRTRIPYVRVYNGEVQTSWGIRVPLRRAMALYRLATHCKACEHEYRPRKRQTIDGYPIDLIDTAGSIRAGCHFLPYSVQHEAAKLAGLAR